MTASATARGRSIGAKWLQPASSMTVADVEAGVAAGVAKVTAEGLLVRKVVISHLHPAVREKIL